MNDAELKKLLIGAKKISTSTLTERMKTIIRWETSEGRRWKELENSCGAAANSWQQMYKGKQRPTVEMIEGIAQCWPHYAFWLITGLADPKSGHSAPKGELLWPEEEISDGLSGARSWESLIELKKAIQKVEKTDDDEFKVVLTNIVNVLPNRLKIDKFMRELKTDKK